MRCSRCFTEGDNKVLIWRECLLEQRTDEVVRRQGERDDLQGQRFLLDLWQPNSVPLNHIISTSSHHAGARSSGWPCWSDRTVKRTYPHDDDLESEAIARVPGGTGGVCLATHWTVGPAWKAGRTVIGRRGRGAGGDGGGG